MISRKCPSSNTRASINLLVHLNRILANVMVLAELSSRSSSSLNISDNRLKMGQKLLDLQSLCLHRLREFSVFGMCSFELLVQRRLRFL